MSVEKAKWCYDKNYTAHCEQSRRIPFADFLPDYLKQKEDDESTTMLRAFLNLPSNSWWYNAMVEHNDARKFIQMKNATLKNKDQKFIVVHEFAEFRTASYFTACTSSSGCPSVEHQIFSRHDPHFNSINVDIEKLRADYPEMVANLKPTTPKCIWRAAEIWRTVDAVLDDMASYTFDDQVEIPLMAYAVATLVQSPWPLAQMLERFPASKNVYGKVPLLGDKDEPDDGDGEAGSEGGGEGKEEAGDTAGGEESYCTSVCGSDGGGPASKDPGTLAGTWREQMERIARLAGEAAVGIPMLTADEIKVLADEADEMAKEYLEVASVNTKELVDQLIETAKALFSDSEDFAVTEDEMGAMRQAWLKGLESGWMTVDSINDAIRDTSVQAGAVGGHKNDLAECRKMKEDAQQVKDTMERARQTRELRNRENEIIDAIGAELEAILKTLRQADMVVESPHSELPTDAPPEEGASKQQTGYVEGPEPVEGELIRDISDDPVAELEAAAEPVNVNEKETMTEPRAVTGVEAEAEPQTVSEPGAVAIVAVLPAAVKAIEEDQVPVHEMASTATSAAPKRGKEPPTPMKTPVMAKEVVAEEGEDLQAPSAEAELLLARNGMSGRIVTSLLAEKNYSAAWMAANLCRQYGVVPPLDEVVIKALAIAPNINYSDGELADMMFEFINGDKGIGERGVEELSPDSGVASFFVIAACLRAALIAPQTEAAQVLDNTRPVEADGVYNLVQSVVAYGKQHRPLDLRILKNSMTLVTWRNELREVSEVATRWLGDAYNYRIKFIPAMRVWQRWLENNGLIQQAVALVTTGDIANLPQIEAELKRLSDRSFIDSRIKTTDETLRPVRGGMTTEIDYEPKRTLHAYVSEACDLLRRFKYVAESKPSDGRNKFTNKMVDDLRDGFNKYLQPARQCLENIIERQDGILMAISARACLDAINDVANLFDENAPTPFETPLSRHLINRQTLLAPELETDNDWSPVFEDPITAARTLLQSIKAGRTSIREIFDYADNLKQHTVTERIIEVLEADGVMDEAEILRGIRSTHLHDCQKNLRARLDDYSRTFSDLLNYGSITFNEFNLVIGKIASLQGSISKITNFAATEREFDKWDIMAKERAKAVEAKLAARLEALPVDQGSAMAVMIREKLKDGDFALAEDYLLRASRGGVLNIEEDQRDVFRDFATRRLPLIEKYLGETRFPDVLMNLNGGNIIAADITGSVNSKEVSKAYSDFVTAGIRGQVPNESDARIALNALGLEVTGFSRTNDSKVFRIKTTPISDRNVCQLAMYGSEAKGAYRIVVHCGTVNENEVVRTVAAAPNPEAGPVLVLVFGIFSEASRRRLAKLCRDRARTFLVIDYTLVYAAATSPLPMLAAVFRLATPWTYYNPYTEGGGAVPPEMFYGREREIASITGYSSNATAFIYGGRQLGKTAMLDTVTKRFNNGSNHVAINIDLLARGFGKGEALHNFWSVLTSALRSKNVIEEEEKTGKDGQCLEVVSEWLEKDNSRRILLMLDEADRFLNEDGKTNFSVTGKLKYLKDASKSRFHLVFSGLHNVKRTTVAVNDPLVQLGSDIPIGPLLDEHERRDAERLIEEPMAACGYYFQRKELVWRVMFLALYSPSLIQIFCSKLMKYVNLNLPVYDGKHSGPPYIITERDINDAYRTQELREDIIYRFNKTLELDGRYDVIACVIANDMLSNPGRRDTYDPIWLRDESMKYWPEGFSQYTGALDRFKVLLKEMEGLGVLLSEGDHYTFRTSAIANIMGTPTAIEDRLLQERKKKEAYTSLDILHPSKANSVELAPLSITDLRALGKAENAVIIVEGTKAAGIESLPYFLDMYKDGVTWRELSSKRSSTGKQFKLADFEAWLGDVMKKRSHGTTIMIVEYSARWGGEWVAAARKKVEKRTSDTSFIKVLFEARPENIAYLLEHGVHIHQLVNKPIYRCLQWHADMVAEWVDEKLHGPAGLEQSYNSAILYEKTCGWPHLLYKFEKAVQSSPRQWQNHLERICSFADEASIRENLQLFGIDPASNYFSILWAFAGVGPAKAEELAEMFDDQAEKRNVPQALEWAYQCGLAKLEHDQSYLLDQVVSNLLESGGAVLA